MHEIEKELNELDDIISDQNQQVETGITIQSSFFVITHNFRAAGISSGKTRTSRSPREVEI